MIKKELEEKIRLLEERIVILESKIANLEIYHAPMQPYDSLNLSPIIINDSNVRKFTHSVYLKNENL